MSVLEENINRINNKLQQLLKNHELLIKQNEQLTKEISDIKGREQKHLERIEEILLQVNILKSSSGQLNGTDKKIFEKQISQYIKEIDKCIGLLSE